MAKDSMTPILLLGGAGLAYWGYTQGWFSSLFGAAAAVPASSGASSPGAAAGTGSGPGTPAPSGPSQPSYSGPSLDQMFQSLQSAVQAAYGSDPALSCGVGSPQSLSGYGAVEANAPRGQTNAVAVSRVIAAQSNPLSGGVVTNAPRGAVSGSCSNPLATYDVFNWYLVSAVPSVGSAPNPPDHTTVISLTDYWVWAAPLLKQAMPGLAGGFNGGFGGYAELGMILERQAGGF